MGFTEEQARAAIAESKSWTEALRRLGYCPSGGNPSTLKKYVAAWGISIDHFDPYRGVMERVRKPKLPLEEILIEHSTYSRSNLKQRLLEEGLKQPRCEMCGQGETWRGRHMSMIGESGGPARSDRGVPCPGLRKVERPPYEKLLEEIEATSYLAVGRKVRRL